MSNDERRRIDEYFSGWDNQRISECQRLRKAVRYTPEYISHYLALIFRALWHLAECHDARSGTNSPSRYSREIAWKHYKILHQMGTDLSRVSPSFSALIPDPHDLADAGGDPVDQFRAVRRWLEGYASVSGVTGSPLMPEVAVGLPNEEPSGRTSARISIVADSDVVETLVVTGASIDEAFDLSSWCPEGDVTGIMADPSGGFETACVVVSTYGGMTSANLEPGEAIGEIASPEDETHSQGTGQEELQNPSSSIPRWCRHKRELWFGDILVKKYVKSAPRQMSLLDALANQGWPRWPESAESPFGVDKSTLDQTIKDLNSSLDRSCPFRFKSDNMRVTWELKE